MAVTANGWPLHVWAVRAWAVTLALAAVIAAPPAPARPLDAIKQRGVLSLCAHPNALPFSSRRGGPHGLHIDLGEALARALGLRLGIEWIVNRYQPRLVDCDIILGSIVDRQAQARRRIRLSHPYYLSGVALALPPTTGTPADDGGELIRGFGDLRPGQRVGVLVGSLASRYLETRGIRTIPYGFEDEMIEALVGGHIEAAAVSPGSAGYYNLTHPEAPTRLIHAYETEPALSWAVAVGLRRADWDIVHAVNGAVARLLADGTVSRIYARWGIEYRPPAADD